MLSSTTPRTPLALLLLITLATILTSWPRSASGQTTPTCEPPQVCMTRELHQSEVRRGAENLCATAVAKSRRIDEYRTTAATAQAAHQQCEGRVALLEEQLANYPEIPDSWAPPLWLVLPLRTVAVGATSGAAYSLARGLPPELTVGLAVGGLGALVVDVVLALVSR